MPELRCDHWVRMCRREDVERVEGGQVARCEGGAKAPSWICYQRLPRGLLRQQWRPNPSSKCQGAHTRDSCLSQEDCKN